jgi:hypothetical protein
MWNSDIARIAVDMIQFFNHKKKRRRKRKVNTTVLTQPVTTAWRKLKTGLEKKWL